MKTAYQIIEIVKNKPRKPVDLSKFAESLGEDMPEFPADRIGRFRVQQILRRRFGTNYKSHPLAREIIEHFDREVKAFEHLSKR